MSYNVPEPPVTGHRGIDDALAGLKLDGPVADHSAGFQQVHGVLQQVLNPAADPAGTIEPRADRFGKAEPAGQQPDVARSAPRPGSEQLRR